MNECYLAALTANAVTLLALFAGAAIAWVLNVVASWIRERWQIRRDRKRIDKLMADTEAKLERPYTPTNP